jgi:hyperosmotically inducible protein
MITRAISLLVLFALVVPMLVAQSSKTDDQLYDEVHLKLANDPDVKGAGLEVIVKAGVVTLRGKVHDDKAKEKAQKLTKSVKGVVSVTNELKIFGQD